MWMVRQAGSVTVNRWRVPDPPR